MPVGRKIARLLVEIAATLMTGYRSDELKSGDVSLLIGLLGKIGFSPNERGKMNLPRSAITHEANASEAEKHHQWKTKTIIYHRPQTAAMAAPINTFSTTPWTNSSHPDRPALRDSAASMMLNATLIPSHNEPLCLSLSILCARRA
jgi:hypothetical protein